MLTDTELGHGYVAGETPPALQQTVAGLHVQLLGGADLRSSTVQAYLEWLRNRYRWQNLTGVGGAYSSLAYWYYAWALNGTLAFIESSGVTPPPGGLDAEDIGTLGPHEPPLCAVRQVHKEPATTPRPPAFGPGAPGYYWDEAPSVYFDFAHTLLSQQCPPGLGSTSRVLRLPAPRLLDRFSTQSLAAALHSWFIARPTQRRRARPRRPLRVDAEPGSGQR